MENNQPNTIDRKGQTITFYSYKGGVGRSMALVNIACLAAKENKKILLIDCDLEAPGLHQFFKVKEGSKGFVDLISDVKEWISIEDNNNEEGYCQFMGEQLENYIEKNVNPVASNTFSLGMGNADHAGDNKTDFDKSVSIDLIKAGRFDNNYSTKLNSIEWLEIYKLAPSFFRTFAYCLEKSYDYIFIDARTGLADTSGICTMLMPQKLVLVFALNNQNINGVVDVARQAIDYRLSSNDYRELQVYPLPSRIENSANPYLQEWIDNYKEKFVALFTEKYMLDECNLSSYFDRSFIQYYAIHAYGENIPALYENSGSSNFIAYNYNSFFAVLKKDLPAWDILSIEEELGNERLASEHLNNGLELFYKQELKESIEEYLKAIELNPFYAQAYNALGTSYSFLAKYTEAINCFDKAIDLKADYAIAYYNRGLVKNNLNLSIDSLNDYTKSIDLDPSKAESYVNRGIIYLSDKLTALAEKDFNRAIELVPNLAKAFYNRGVLYESLNQNEKALSDYTKAIEIKPDYAGAYNNRGVVKGKLKLYDEAMKDFDKTIEIMPDSEIAYNNKGNIFKFQNLYSEALLHFQKALELKPDFITAKNNIESIKKVN